MYRTKMLLKISAHLAVKCFRINNAQAKPSKHDDVIKWKHSPRSWAFVRGIHRSPVNSPYTPASDAELWCVFFNLCPNKRLSKQWWGWWFETPSRSLWRIEMFQGMLIIKGGDIPPVTFDVADISMAIEENVEILRVHNDDRLQPDRHIWEICKNASKHLNAISRVSTFSDKKR